MSNLLINKIKKHGSAVKKKLVKLKSDARLFILRKLLQGRFSERNVFLITSTPRSGSTLLGNILNTIPKSCVLFEPLQLNHVPESKDAGYQWRTYRSPEVEWKDGKDFMIKIFKGNVISHWTAREISIKDGFRANKLIVKCVRANRLLPWICNNFDIPVPVLLLRHPCGVIASQLKSSDWNTTKKPSLPEYVKDFPGLLETYHQAKYIEEYLAISWSLDQIPPLIFRKQYPCIVVTYEELLKDPKHIIAKIANTWKVELSLEKALSAIKKPSSVVYKSGISGIDGWKSQLSEDQIRRILKIVHGFGLYFYNENTTPDLKMLDSTIITLDKW